eukprot:12575-Heterococcus_DN1.PRE.1
MDVVGSEDTATASTAAAAAAAAVAAVTAAAVSRELSAAVDIYGDGEIDGDEFGGGSETNGSAADSSFKSEDIFGTREDCELPSDDDEDDDLLCACSHALVVHSTGAYKASALARVC